MGNAFQKKFYKSYRFTLTSVKILQLVFDLPYNFKFVQSNCNKSKLQSYVFEHIYKFYVHKHHSCRKYIVEVKEYEGKLYTLDFYAKVSSDHKSQKYRLTTNQFSGGRLGATILSIMLNVFLKRDVTAFGIVAAALTSETDNAYTKRFQTYVKVLRLTTKAYFDVFVNTENSFIFIIRKEHIEESQLIISTYDTIFKETV